MGGERDWTFISCRNRINGHTNLCAASGDSNPAYQDHTYSKIYEIIVGLIRNLFSRPYLMYIA
jgi:hypothetical protein